MGNRVGVAIALVLAVALVAGTGCVSKGMYKKDVEDTDQRIGAVEDAVEANGRKLADLGKETDQKLAALDSKASQAVDVGNQAMSKATAAEKTAQGRLIWDVTIKDEGVKFDFGQAKLTASAISSLDEVISKVKG